MAGQMDTPDQRKIISAMYLDIINGDIHTRHQYIPELISHAATLLKHERIEPHIRPIAIFRTRLHTAISMILHNTHPLPSWDTRREAEILKLEMYFKRFVIKIDDDVADEIGIEQITVLADIEAIEYCRNICYTASADYSSMMAGNPEGMTNATNKYAYVMNILTEMLWRYRSVNISESDYSRVAAAAQRRMDTVREDAKKVEKK